MTLLKKLKSKCGFTLAELIIVVAIIAVLSGIAFTFVNPKEISYIEYNRSAEAIATAVQNRLTEIRNAGDMAVLRNLGEKSPEKTDEVNRTAATDDEGGYRYVFNYGEENTEIGYILPFGSIDLDLNKNYIAVGFQSDTGIVGDVFYSPKAFGERTINYLLELKNDPAKRKIEDVGYYKGTIDDQEVAFANLPTPQLTITNYEELTLSIYLPYVTQLETYNKQLGILVSLSDKDGEAYTKYKLNLIDTAIYSTFSLGTSDTDVNGPVIVPQKISSGATYSMILDTVKKCHPGDMGNRLSDESTPNLPSINPPKGVFEDWAKRSKAYEKGALLLGDNSVVTVTVYCVDTEKYGDVLPIDPTFMPRSVSVTFNGWFNRYGSSTVDIACGRHLQNLGKLTQINEKLEKYLPNVTEENGVYTYGDYNYGMANTFTDGSSNASPQVEYDDITIKYDYSRELNVKKIKKANQVNAIDFDCDGWKNDKGEQIAFKPLNLPSDFTYYGNYLTIDHLYVNTDFYAGLFGYAYHAKLYDILLVNPSITSQMPAHLAELYEMGVGGLIGTSRHSSDIYNCQIYMTKEKGSYNEDSRITGECYVGGLIGFCEDEDIQHCSASVYTGYAEGAKRNLDGEEISISSKYVGGLIGCITGDSKISDCYAAGNLSGEYVGGLVGYIVEDSDPSGDDYRIETCYTAGHIEYAAKQAAGILGYVSELTGNIRSALSIYKNYCVIVYGKKNESGKYEWSYKDANGNTVPIYGTFRGDGFEWLRTSTLGFSDTYLTGNYAGETFFAGAVFDYDNRNYYIAQQGIVYSNSPYYTSMMSTVIQLLQEINDAKSTKDTLNAKVKEAQDKINWLKKLQALEDLKRAMENIIYQVESETGTYTVTENGKQVTYKYNEGGFYKYGRTIHFDTTRARVEGENEKGHTYVDMTAVQALHVMYDGTYTDSEGNKKTVTMSYEGSDADKKKLKNDFGGVYTFMDYYNFLREQYLTLLNDTATDTEKTTAQNNLVTMLGDNSSETYTTMSDGKEEVHQFYENGLLYKHFFSDLLYRLFDKAKDYFQNDMEDKTGELIFRHFRSDLAGKFREILCDLGISPVERAKFLLNNKVATLNEAINSLNDYPTIIEKWTGSAKSEADDAKSYANDAKTKLTTLLNDLEAGNITPEKLKEDIAAADAPLKSLYDLLDKYKAVNQSEDTGDWDAVDKDGNKGDMRKLRDPILIIRKNVALCEATSGSGVEGALDHLMMELTATNPDLNSLVEAFTEEVNGYIGEKWKFSDSGHRVKNAEEMRNAARGFIYGQEVESERHSSLGFMYDYGNESDNAKLPNPYVLPDHSYVNQDNGVYNNVFPYTENDHTKYYPFPFVYGMALETDSSFRASYILFHYGDWLTNDLWADPTLSALNEASVLMTQIKSGLQEAIESAGSSGSTGKIDKQINNLCAAIDECADNIDNAFKADSEAARTTLNEIENTITEWLQPKGDFAELLAVCKNNKAISADIRQKIENYGKQLEALNEKIKRLVNRA